MKTMKKLTALVLVLALVLNVSAVLADEEIECIAEVSIEETVEGTEEIVAENIEANEEIIIVEDDENNEIQTAAEFEAIDEIAVEATVIEQISEEIIQTVIEEKVITGTVSIFACYSDEMTEGDCITLVSEISGLEGCTVSYQWQRDAGNGYEDIAGANGSSYSFAATEESLSYGYRLSVTAE